jgi:hypothetical protein
MFPGRRVSAQFVGAAGAGLLALTMTGCGGSGGNSAQSHDSTPSASSQASSTAPSPTTTTTSTLQMEPVSAAVEAVDKAGTAKVALSSVTTASGKAITLTGTGAIDARAGKAEMTLHTGAAGASTSQLRVVVADGSVFVNGLPGQPKDKWVQSSAGPGSQDGLSGSDPTQALQMLRGASDEVKKAGTAEIRGVPTTRYAGTIDVQKLIARGQGGAANKQQAQKALQAMGVTSIPFEIFIDRQGRPARLVESIQLSMGQKKSQSKVSEDYYDWGAPVDIHVPAKSDIVKAPTPTRSAMSS